MKLKSFPPYSHGIPYLKFKIPLHPIQLFSVVYGFHNSLTFELFWGYGKALAFWEIQSKYTRKDTKNSVLSGLNLENVDIVNIFW